MHAYTDYQFKYTTAFMHTMDDRDFNGIADYVLPEFGPDCTLDCIDIEKDWMEDSFIISHKDEEMHNPKIEHALDKDDSCTVVCEHNVSDPLGINDHAHYAKWKEDLVKNSSSTKTLSQILAELEEDDRNEMVIRGREQEKRALEAQKAIAESRNAGSEIAVRPDKVVSPFKNYQRPVASPKMEVETPFETETGVVMPPLPVHECELPEAVVTEKDKWAGSFDNAKKDTVVIKNNSTFECICGQVWYVTVRKVPFHAAKYEGQYTYGWHKMRWFNFSRRLDNRKRKAQA